MGDLPAVSAERLLFQPAGFLAVPQGRGGSLSGAFQRRASPKLVSHDRGAGRRLLLRFYLPNAQELILSRDCARNGRSPAFPGGSGLGQPPPRGRAGLVPLLRN